ncbi:MAG: T9SS type A sorting domain-containing protein [Bacteroidetes bacterium]|nr:T9SS type A sorting domain-containing protein [Bacteroidota bacterium]
MFRKTTITIFSLFMLVNTLLAQGIVDTAKIWSTVIHRLPSFTIATEHIKFEGDTTIDPAVYKKVWRSTDEFHDYWSPYGFIRETIENQVYFRTDTSQQEYLLNDFGLNVNDTVKIVGIGGYANSSQLGTISMKVLSIDSISVGSENRKQLHLGPVCDFDTTIYETEQWIEGIGSMSGILHWEADLVGGNSYSLLCYTNSSILEYQNPTYSTCYMITGIERFSPTTEFFIHPNPISDNSQLFIPAKMKNRRLTVRVFNSIGQVVRTEEITGAMIIDKCHYSSGIYYLVITEPNGFIKSGRFLVK